MNKKSCEKYRAKKNGVGYLQFYLFLPAKGDKAYGHAIFNVACLILRCRKMTNRKFLSRKEIVTLKPNMLN